MKKVLLAGILSIFFVSVSFAQVKFGVTAGLNVSNLVDKDLDAKFKAGFQAGVVADMGISPSFSIIPELLFSQRGGKYEIENLSTTETLNYLQLPVNAAYKIDAGYGSKVLIFAGPYLGYAVSGKIKDNNSKNIEFGSGVTETKPLDLGINAGIGYQFEKVFFKLQYNQGLSNLSNVSDKSTKNQNIAVSMGYFF